MYLTRVELDINKRETLYALSHLNRIHGAVESTFEGDRKRNLWRVDQLGKRYYLLILSEDIPNTGKLIQQFGVPEREAESKEYLPLLNRVENDSEWHFRLVANPTISKKTNNKERGTVMAHISTKFQMEWLHSQGQRNGFSLNADATINGKRWYSFKRNGSEKSRIKFLSVAYEGTLKVVDRNLFCEALLTGLGREKAYGQGLMTLVKLNG